jgi:hypothetical protein
MNSFCSLAPFHGVERTGTVRQTLNGTPQILESATASNSKTGKRSNRAFPLRKRAKERLK